MAERLQTKAGGARIGKYVGCRRTKKEKVCNFTGLISTTKMNLIIFSILIFLFIISTNKLANFNLQYYIQYIYNNKTKKLIKNII